MELLPALAVGTTILIVVLIVKRLIKVRNIRRYNRVDNLIFKNKLKPRKGINRNEIQFKVNNVMYTLLEDGRIKDAENKTVPVKKLFP